MILSRFTDERSGAWTDLEKLVGEAKGRPGRLQAGEIRRLGSRYRETVADLAIARRAFPGDPIVGRLEALVVSARPLVYHRRRRSMSLRHLITHGYWAEVRRRPIPLLASALLLLVPALITTFWANANPDAAAEALPANFAALAEKRDDAGGLGMSAAESTFISGYIFVNNIRVALMAFVGGMTAGLLTIFVLVQNGGLHGLLAGVAIWAGNGPRLFELTAAHGVLEISLIIVAGATGLRVAWAFIDPGHRGRGDALIEEARSAFVVAIGTSLCLVVCGIIEGFITPIGLTTWGAVGVGFVFGALYWWAVINLGKPKDTDLVEY